MVEMVMRTWEGGERMVGLIRGKVGDGLGW